MVCIDDLPLPGQNLDIWTELQRANPLMSAQPGPLVLLLPKCCRPCQCLSIVEGFVGDASALNHCSEGAVLHAQQVGNAVVLQPLAIMHHQHLHERQYCEPRPFSRVTAYLYHRAWLVCISRALCPCQSPSAFGKPVTAAFGPWCGAAHDGSHIRLLHEGAAL